MAKAVTTTGKSALPAHLSGYAKEKVGNIDRTDLVIPRIKLLQGLSPEIESFETAKPGRFWHTTADEVIGDKMLGIVIVVKKSFVLWAPRQDDRQILARAADGIHWDQPGASFTVKPKNSPKEVTYHLKDTVAESGLDKFGSGIPGDPNSTPAASLTYNTLWYFPELPEFSPAVIINTRSSVKPMQQLLSKIDSKPVAHFTQLYEIGIKQVMGAEGPYYNYTYTGAGYADAETCQVTEELYDRFAETEWTANEEAEEEGESSGGSRRNEGPVTEEEAGKF